MTQIGAIERTTQNCVVKFFVDKLHYTYLGNLHDSENSNIMQERLYAYLTVKGGYSDKLSRRSIDELVRTAGDLQHGLYDANMKLLIVVDKLLTGFDAPPCTYFYIDKAMHDHGLFQAICRVNRLDDESKDFGYIVDYKQLFGDLANAINTYT